MPFLILKPICKRIVVRIAWLIGNYVIGGSISKEKRIQTIFDFF